MCSWVRNYLLFKYSCNSLELTPSYMRFLSNIVHVSWGRGNWYVFESWGDGSQWIFFALRMPNSRKGVIPSRASSSINISSLFSGDCSQAFLLLPWFAKVGFLYPPPFPHGRPCSQNSRTILADGMIWCKYSTFPTLKQQLKAKIPKWGVTPCPLLKWLKIWCLG